VLGKNFRQRIGEESKGTTFVSIIVLMTMAGLAIFVSPQATGSLTILSDRGYLDIIDNY